MVPLETPARLAISWSLALARPHSPKTWRAASMICWGRCSGRRRHLGAAAFDFAGEGFVWGIAKQIITDRSVIYARPNESSTTCPTILRGGRLRRGRRRHRLAASIAGVRQQHYRSQEQEQCHCADDQSRQCRAQIGLLFRRHHFPAGPLVTLAFDTVSFALILGTTSTPSITFPKTVWTPFRCLVFCSLRTMK